MKVLVWLNIQIVQFCGFELCVHVKISAKCENNLYLLVLFEMFCINDQTICKYVDVNHTVNVLSEVDHVSNINLSIIS